MGLFDFKGNSHAHYTLSSTSDTNRSNVFLASLLSHYYSLSYLSLWLVQLVSAFSAEELGFVLRRLQELRDFMAKHSQFASPLLAERYVLQG